MSRGALSRFVRTGFFSVLALGFATGSVLVSANFANAADVTWGGAYRIEANKVVNSELSSANSDKSYLLHHLLLTPKIVAADGFVIYGRLDVLNDPNFGINNNGQVNSVAGDLFGNNPGAGNANPATGTDSNAFSRTQRASPLQVTSLYATWNQEFGQAIFGRTPLQFGLGTAFSSGSGLFDHYITTKDLAGYKVVLGNLFVLPMIAKTSEGALGQQDDVDDYMVQIQYDNPESELSLGGIYQIHVVTGQDTPFGANTIGGAGATRAGSYKNNLIAIFASEKIGQSWRASVEADLYSGDIGVTTSTGSGVALNAFGVAAEVAWQPADSRWNANIKFGLASGDDPGTNDVYEGYQFNRNYDVGLLLFNHPLGQRDFLRTGLVRDTTTAASSQIDSEAVSNAAYFAPTVSFKQRENLSYGATFVYGILNKDPIGNNSGTSLNLGYELDLSVTWKPFERMTWTTAAGALLPGDAWRGGNLQLENKMPYAVTTKAAISF